MRLLLMRVTVLVLLLLCPFPANAGTVSVTLVPDDDTLLPGESTMLRVWAEVNSEAGINGLDDDVLVGRVGRSH